MIGETDDMIIPPSWLHRLSKRGVYLLIVGCVTVGSAVSVHVYTFADMQRRLNVLEQDMREQVKAQNRQNQDQLLALAKLTERLDAWTQRFSAMDSRLSDIDRNVRRMAQ